MLIGDSSSSQNTQRQRRLAAEDRARADRGAQDVALREGVAREVGARVAGEVPQRVEVDRFRALMQGGRNAEPRASSKGSEANVQGTQQAQSDEGAVLVQVGPQGVAERFRAAMQRAFGAADGAKGEAPKDDKVGLETQPAQVAGDAQSDARIAQDHRPVRADEGARLSNAELPKTLGKDSGAAQSSAATDGSVDTEQLHTGDKGDVPSAQQLARKAEHGETQAAQATRAAHSSGKDEGSEGKDASMAQVSANAAPAMMPTESMTPMPQQPQAAAMAQAQPAAGGFTPALSDLIQKHVRQMLVTDPRSTRGRSREVLLRMQNDAMPGTDLWLTRTDDGWRLRAEVSSRDAYDLLLEHQDDLVQRFAQSRLGELSIEPIFHDSAGVDHSPMRSHASITRPG